MKFLVSLVIICGLVGTIQAYSFLIPPKIGLPGVCMYHGMMLQRGDNNMPSACQNMHCNEDGSILVQGCGHYDMRDCRILDPINLYKPYPDCCKMNFMCTLANGEVINREISPLMPRAVYA